MSTSAELIRGPFAAIAEDRRLHYFRTLLKDFDQDVATKRELFVHFREWLDQLTGEVILRSYRRHYNPTYLNLLSVFGEELPAEEVQALTIECIKTKIWNECEYYFHLSQLLERRRSGEKLPVRLKSWNADLIRSLLKGGRGLIICSFRFGAIRDLPVELALLGFPICEAVNKPTHEVMQSAFGSLDPWPLKTVNAEDSRCTVELVNALKRSEVIGLCIEGNTGSDGPWGDTSKSTINFLGHTIGAKNGAARLAAAIGAPILPVMALKDGDGSGELAFMEPIIPLPGLRRSQNDRFVQATMQSLYTLLETYVRRYPEQWEGWSALHRWRLRGDDANASNSVAGNTDPQAIAELLRDGKKFTVNQGRVAQLPTKDGVMWVDLKTLKGFQNPKWAGQENVLATLSAPRGLDLAWINRSNGSPDWEEKICLLLAYLQQSGLVAAC